MNNNVKNIATSIEKINKFKFFFGLEIKDLIFSIIFILVFLIISIPMIIIGGDISYVGWSIIIFAVILNTILLIDFDNTRVYNIIFNMFYFYTKNKYISLNKIEKIDENMIILKDGKKIKFFRVIGTDTSYIKNDDFNFMVKELQDLFRDKDNLFILKIDGKINIDENINLLKERINKCKNNIFKKELEKNLQEMINIKEDENSSLQIKYYIAYQYEKKEKIEENKSFLINNNQILSKSGIELFIPKKIEMEEIVNNFYFQNKKIKELSHAIVLENVDNVKKYSKFIKISSFPKYVDREWLSGLFNTKGIMINITIDGWKKDQVKKKINRIIVEIENKLNTINFANKFKEEELLFDYDSFTEMIKIINNQQGYLNKVDFTIKLEANDMHSLRSSFKILTSDLLKNGFGINQLNFLQREALDSFIPINKNNKGKNRDKVLEKLDILSENLAYGFPFNSLELIHKNTLMLGKDKYNTPIFIDFKKRSKDLPSSSLIVLGKTGSGKSTTIKRIIKNQILDGNWKVFIIDPENEYNKLDNDNSRMINDLDGEVVNFNKENMKINPFKLIEFGKDIDGNINFDPYEYKKSFIKIFYGIIFKNSLSEGEINLISQKTSSMYDLWKTREFTFSDIYKTIYNDKNIQNKNNILNQFGIYCKSIKGIKNDNGFASKIWDNKSSISLNKDLINFELQELQAYDENIKNAQIFQLLSYLDMLVMKNPVYINENDLKKNYFINIVIDEAHLLLNEKNEDVVKFIQSMFKRIRKYNGMISIITQNISDLYKPKIIEYTSTFMNNAEYLFIHSFKWTEIEALNELLKHSGGLSDDEYEFIKNAQSGEAILFFNKNRIAMNVIK